MVARPPSIAEVLLMLALLLAGEAYAYVRASLDCAEVLSWSRLIDCMLLLPSYVLRVRREAITRREVDCFAML